MKKIQALTYYEILGLDKGTTTIALGNRYKELKEFYKSSHYFMRGLMSEKELFIYNQLLDHIITVMKEPELRREYDMELTERLLSLKSSLPDTFDLQEVVRRYDKQLKNRVKKIVPQDVFGRKAVVNNSHITVDKEMLTSVVATLKEIEIGGNEIRKIREATGMSAQVLSDRTRISRFILVSIEDEKFDVLPAITYVRGFLNSITKTLKLEKEFAEKVLADYISRMKKAKTDATIQAEIHNG